jgi:phosphoglycerate dehydrogenase-like enzyme
MALPQVYVAVNLDLARELGLDQQLERLRAVAQVERWQEAGRPSPEAVADAARRAHVLITGLGTPALADLAGWSSATFAVRLIAHTGGSVRHLVPKTAVEHGLIVTHAAAALADAVAEHTIALMLAARRRIVTSMARLQSGKERVPIFERRELGGATVGIVGAGVIGRRVMELLAPWRVELLLYDPYCSPPSAAKYGAQLVGLEELLGRSDIVSLHAPLTPETTAMLGAAELAMMQDGSLLVNTARGRLIDSDALLAELQSGRIAAALDVTDPHEPLPPSSPFLGLENCIVTPHIAGPTLDARRRQGRDAVDETIRFLGGEALRYHIPPERWELVA